MEMEEEEEDFAWEPSVRHTDAGLPKTKTVLQVRQDDFHFFKSKATPVVCYGDVSK